MDQNDRDYTVMADAVARTGPKEVTVKVRARNRDVFTHYTVKNAVLQAAGNLLRDPGIKKLESVKPINEQGEVYHRTSRHDPSPVSYEGTYICMSL